jgi:hypothetical protein
MEAWALFSGSACVGGGTEGGISGTVSPKIRGDIGQYASCLHAIICSKNARFHGGLRAKMAPDPGGVYRLKLYRFAKIVGID